MSRTFQNVKFWYHPARAMIQVAGVPCVTHCCHLSHEEERFFPCGRSSESRDGLPHCFGSLHLHNGNCSLLTCPACSGIEAARGEGYNHHTCMLSNTTVAWYFWLKHSGHGGTIQWSINHYTLWKQISVSQLIISFCSACSANKSMLEEH